MTAMTEQIQRTMENLKKHRYDVKFVETKEEVLPIIEEMIPEGSLVGSGGSLTLAESGVMDLLRSGKYQYLDRFSKDVTDEERETMGHRAHSADFFLCSSNAVIEDGCLYNVDGNSNRITSIVYGPKKVIMVVSVNKIVKTLDDAIYRVKSYVAPKNCARAGMKTYCATEGICMALKLKEKPGMTEGCDSPGRSCCNHLISTHQRVPGRITVILVGEPLGL
ncbi:MAG: lactate utilization protein [Peptococcaceae bacterium]|nr:lactate utilization protein [Peptococcaceae bacterium]